MLHLTFAVFYFVFLACCATGSQVGTQLYIYIYKYIYIITHTHTHTYILYTYMLNLTFAVFYFIFPAYCATGSQVGTQFRVGLYKMFVH